MQHILCFTALLSLSGLAPVAAEPTPVAQIAFLPDVHFHDVYASFEDDTFTGITLDSGEKAVLRSMQAQLRSTRLFNENYFAFIAALDDIAQRGISLVALPGDFSDDGQSLHLRGLANILRRYEQEHGMRFLLTPGNHDPVRPFTVPGGKPDFLGEDGQALTIYSHQHTECRQQRADICSDELEQLGYAGIFAHLSDFGFTPRRSDIYFETPFWRPQGDYSSQQGLAAAELAARQYEPCADGDCQTISDTSYLIEPIDGLWLLALDANVYELLDDHASDANLAYASPSNAGYNALVEQKPFLVEWISNVAARADAQGKTLITFSHYPMVDFYHGTGTGMAELFGPDSAQLRRLPTAHTAERLAATGLRLHVGGHMHFNHTSSVADSSGNTLVNIQAPSIAGYRPAYKLLTVHSDQSIKVETLLVEDIDGFDTFFAAYTQEHAQGAPWSPELLNSTSYGEMVDWHLHELVRQRFIPREWPQPLKQAALELSAEELAQQLSLPETISEQWQWSMLTLAEDFYRVRNASSLGLNHISNTRLAEYQALHKAVQLVSAQHANYQLAQQIAQLLDILFQLQKSPASQHFWVQPDGTIENRAE
ncbi:MAG: metallophosphoesterase [Firmicutes bacterium]|nr:metallophosphoesterase [Bacillota bacterium]